MHQFGIIKDIVIIMSVSLPIIFLFKKINIPSILGFLAAGIIIGPYGFKLISDGGEIQVMAEIGVILLLFTIGLEVSIGRLISMRKMLLYAGGLQVLITVTITSTIFYFFGVPLNRAIFFGMLVSLSSTAIVLKLLNDRNELEAPHGRISLVILIFQDLAIVPMLILLPILSGSGDFSTGRLLLQMGFAFGSVALIVLVARYLMPKILFQLARLRIREAFTVGTILLLLGTAYLTHSIGLSFAIGAFIAGLILSESDFSHQITADILPLKDAFNSIFFVSIGLLLNLNFVTQNFLLLLAITAGIVILKSSIITVLIKLFKYPLRVALAAGLGLSQVGEFSFVLSQAGLSYNLMSGDFYNMFLAASIFSMLLTPFLIKSAPSLGFGLRGRTDSIKPHDEKPHLNNHVIIVGFGLNGRNLARVLKETGIQYVVIEMNPATVKSEKEKGEEIIFGDATRREILGSAGAAAASVIVFAISEPEGLKRGLKLVKEINPGIHAIVRTRFVSEIDDLAVLGADEIIPEEFETSLQIFGKVLEKYGIPSNIIMKQISLLREESYGILRKDSSALHTLYNLDKILAGGLTEIYYIDENNVHLNKTMKELHLRAKTGTTIIAIVREKESITNISSNEKIRAGDRLVITGTHKTVEDAVKYLNDEMKDQDTLRL